MLPILPRTLPIGGRSARLCPAADVMRFFRFGYPADVCVLAFTVGLEDPAPTAEEVDAFVRCEATLNGGFSQHTFSVLQVSVTFSSFFQLQARHYLKLSSLM